MDADASSDSELNDSDFSTLGDGSTSESDSASNSCSITPDSDDDSLNYNYGFTIRLDLIPPKTVRDIRREDSIRKFKAHNLRALCVNQILDDEGYFIELAQKLPTNPLLTLPSTVLDTIRDELQKQVMMEETCIFVALLINPEATTSVRFEGCRRIQLHDCDKPFWDALETTTNLQQLCYLPSPPKDIFDQVVKFEKLQVLRMPLLVTFNRHLVLFSNRFPHLRELLVNHREFNAGFEGVEALAKLTDFRKFVFSTKDYQVAGNEIQRGRIQRFVERCLHLMPYLRRLGHDVSDIDDEEAWQFSHPIQAIDHEVEIGLEALLLKNSLAVPAGCSFPYLKELYLYNPQGDLSALDRFKFVRHLYVTESNSFQATTHVLEKMGLQLTSLHLNSLSHNYGLEQVFNLCPNLEKINVQGEVVSQTFARVARPSKLTDLRIDASFDIDKMVIQSKAFREIIINSNLKNLELANVVINDPDAEYLMGLVERKEILQNIEKIVIADANGDDDGNDEVYIKWIAMCKVKCPKLSTVKLLNGEAEMFHTLLYKADGGVSH